MAGVIFRSFNDDYGEGNRITYLDRTAKEWAKTFGIKSSQVYARKVNLLKNRYQYQIVLKVPEHEFLMLKMAFSDKFRKEVFNSNPLPEDLDFVWEKPSE